MNHDRCFSVVQNKRVKNDCVPRLSPQSTFVLKAAVPPSRAVLAKSRKEGGSISRVQPGFTYSSYSLRYGCRPTQQSRSRGTAGTSASAGETLEITPATHLPVRSSLMSAVRIICCKDKLNCRRFVMNVTCPAMAAEFHIQDC